MHQHPAPVPLDLLVGPERAAAFLKAKVDALVSFDWIPESRAYAIVCEAACDGDPWTLADPGQIWTPGPDLAVADAVAAQLYIAARDGAHLLVEDEYGQREWAEPTVLAGWRLDHWSWARADAKRTP